MDIEEGEELQVKEISNRFSKIITENFPNLKKVLLTQVQETSRTPKRFEQKRTFPWHIIIKTTNTETEKEY
jgi:hypothetical protein